MNPLVSLLLSQTGGLTGAGTQGGLFSPKAGAATQTNLLGQGNSAFFLGALQQAQGAGDAGITDAEALLTSLNSITAGSTQGDAASGETGHVGISPLLQDVLAIAQQGAQNASQQTAGALTKASKTGSTPQSGAFANPPTSYTELAKYLAHINNQQNGGAAANSGAQNGLAQAAQNAGTHNTAASDGAESLLTADNTPNGAVPEAFTRRFAKPVEQLSLREEYLRKMEALKKGQAQTELKETAQNKPIDPQNLTKNSLLRSIQAYEGAGSAITPNTAGNAVPEGGVAGIFTQNAAPALASSEGPVTHNTALGIVDTSPKAAVASKNPVPNSHSLPLQPTAAEQISVRVTQMVNLGQGHIRIQLHPAELGQVDIKIDMPQQNVGQNTAVSIAVDRQETLDLLQRDARTLERALNDAGIKTDSGNLNFSLRGEQQQASGGEGQKSFNNLVADGQDAGDATSQEIVKEYTAYVSDSGLDIRV